MYEEQMNELAAQYLKQHLRPFKNVAERAYKDGFQDALKFIRMRHEMDNEEFDYGHNINHHSEDEA